MQLNLLVKPVAEVHTAACNIYLYPLGIGDVNEFVELHEELDVTAKFSKFLPFIASLTVPKDFRDKRQPLPAELVEQMSAEELEELANVYMGISSFDKVRAGNAAENIAAVTRRVDEPAISCLDRLLNAEAERHRRIFAQLYAEETSPAGEEN